MSILTFMGGLLCASIWACAIDDGENTDPCQGISCSNAGRCDYDGVSLFCICNDGYRSQGVACVPSNVGNDGGLDADNSVTDDSGLDADATEDNAVDSDCFPDCEDRECGSNGCNGQCGPGCDSGESCNESTGTCWDAAGFVAGVTCGKNHSCAWMHDGVAFCWGRGLYFQLGDGGTADRNIPWPVSGMAGVSGMSAGCGFSCAWNEIGNAFCWGTDSGALGTVSSTAKFPTLVDGIENVDGISAAQDHTCAWLVDGAAFCWGSDYHGQLGDDAEATWYNTPRPVALSDSVRGITTGERHSCAWFASGGPLCWGRNATGQVDPSIGREDVMTPVAVTGVGDVSGMTAGDHHTCAWHDGRATCWGSNDFGQLGPMTPDNILGMVAGTNYTCAWLDDGTAWCWGQGSSGQLGDGTSTSQPTPVKVLGLTGVVGMSAHSTHTCAWLDDGKAFCWGKNDNGQLGDGTYTSSPEPVLVELP